MAQQEHRANRVRKCLSKKAQGTSRARACLQAVHKTLYQVALCVLKQLNRPMWRVESQLLHSPRGAGLPFTPKGLGATGAAVGSSLLTAAMPSSKSAKDAKRTKVRVPVPE